MKHIITFALYTKLKNITTGRVVDNTFNAGVKLEEVRIERRPYQYLYKDESGYNFMHNETFEQIIIEKDSINGWQYLKEGDICEIGRASWRERVCQDVFI